MIVTKTKSGNQVACASVVFIPDLLTKEAEDVAWELFVQTSAKFMAESGDTSEAQASSAAEAYEEWQTNLAKIGAKMCGYLRSCVAKRMKEMGKEEFYKMIADYANVEESDGESQNPSVSEDQA